MRHERKKYFGGWVLTLIIGILLIIAIILAISLVGPADGNRIDESPMKLGVLLPLTGDQESIGNEYLKGIKVAVEDLKNDGLDITLIIKDTKSETGTAIDEFLNLIYEHVYTIIGPSSANDAEKIALYAETFGINLISLANTNDLDKYEDHVFKYVPTEPSVASAINNMIDKIEGAKETKNNGKICILYSKDAFGYSMVELLTNAIEEDKTNKLQTQSFLIPENINDEQSINNLIDNVAAASPLYICVFTTSPETYIAIENAADKKISKDVYWIGTDYILEKSVAEKLKNRYKTFVLSLTRTMTDDYRKKYTEMFGNEPEDYSISAVSYDAVITLGKVIKSYGTNPNHISEGLKNIRRIGLTGVTKFNEKGNRCLGFSPYVLVDGNWEQQTWKELSDFNSFWETEITY